MGFNNIIWLNSKCLKKKNKLTQKDKIRHITKKRDEIRKETRYHSDNLLYTALYDYTKENNNSEYSRKRKLQFQTADKFYGYFVVNLRLNVKLF